MATRIEHRATFAHSVADVFAAQTDEGALRARLAEIGGKNARIREHETVTDGVRYTLLQRIDARQLPAVVRRIHQGDLTVQREHVWAPTGERYTGTVNVQVGGLPGQITARSELRPQDHGSVLHTRGEVTVGLLLIAGKLESVIAKQVTGLLEHEACFSAKWLAKHS